MAISFSVKSGAGVLFEMEILNGFPIRDYSEFQKEEEVLLEPFTEFKVVGIKEEDKEGQKKVKIIRLKQV